MMKYRKGTKGTVTLSVAVHTNHTEKIEKEGRLYVVSPYSQFSIPMDMFTPDPVPLPKANGSRIHVYSNGETVFAKPVELFRINEVYVTARGSIWSDRTITESATFRVLHDQAEADTRAAFDTAFLKNEEK